jgi:hypothetical protein
MSGARAIGLGMLDPSKIGEALSRPGIDPRTWTTLAVVTAVHVSAQGVYVNITTIAGIEETASVPSAYGGPGFGFYCPVAVGDCVVVAVPEGDWGAGARVLAQVWDQGSAPPDEAIENPRDVALVIEPGRTIRILASGGGDAVIAAEGGITKLGDEAATHEALLTTLFLAQLSVLVAAISTAVGTIPGGGAAATAITTALTAFQNAASSYKSLLVKLA